MAGFGRFLSSALSGLVEDLEAGTEEGVRIEVERIKEDETREIAAKRDRRRVEAERKRLEEEERIEGERRRVKRQKARDERTAFWTTPGLRPLAEPPVLDWDRFFRKRIPSDLRYNALFRDDPENRSRMKDVQGEVAVLGEYAACARMLRDNPATSGERADFYNELFEDILVDWQEVEGDVKDVYEQATELSQFEYMHLDNDGRTTRLEQWLNNGADIFHGLGDEIRKKYRHLIPDDFVESHLATFEFCYAPVQDDVPGRDTEYIEHQMHIGNDVLVGWPEEVQEKYGHLRSLLPQSTPSEEEDPYASLAPDEQGWTHV